MDKVSYSFVRDSSNIVFKSSVQSFGLDHVTEKDIRSFYTEFSKYSALDTGLLPVDGTGLLSIRKAGPYTQVAYQHKPGSYYVNWGANEKDPNTRKYLLAQPYRIIIVDFKDNNLLGARTFYSKIPVTYPGVQLYHVNLPNINCKGYRGNGVGWICLYLKEDWSNLPFNERLALAIERCSGVESYNDANMNETDGPRFYSEMYNADTDFNYLWHPSIWEKKTLEEGYEWTLDAPWIPVMVEGLDSQSKHYSGNKAVPLTFKDALVGKYGSYYHDVSPLKPINSLQRDYGVLPSETIMSYFVQCYNNSSSTFSGIDTMSKSEEFRQTRSDLVKIDDDDYSDSEEEEEEEDSEQEEPF